MNTDRTYFFPEGTPASDIRKLRIFEYSSKLNEPHCLGQNARHNLQAYQQMTDEEILLSEKRERDGEATWDYIKRVREFTKWSARFNPKGPRAKACV